MADKRGTDSDSPPVTEYRPLAGTSQMARTRSFTSIPDVSTVSDPSTSKKLQHELSTDDEQNSLDDDAIKETPLLRRKSETRTSQSPKKRKAGGPITGKPPPHPNRSPKKSALKSTVRDTELDEIQSLTSDKRDSPSPDTRRERSVSFERNEGEPGDEEPGEAETSFGGKKKKEKKPAEVPTTHPRRRSIDYFKEWKLCCFLILLGVIVISIVGSIVIHSNSTKQNSRNSITAKKSKPTIPSKVPSNADMPEECINWTMYSMTTTTDPPSDDNTTKDYSGWCKCFFWTMTTTTNTTRQPFYSMTNVDSDWCTCFYLAMNETATVTGTTDKPFDDVPSVDWNWCNCYSKTMSETINRTDKPFYDMTNVDLSICGNETYPLESSIESNEMRKVLAEQSN